MGKIISQRWQELDCGLQQKYEALAQAEKGHYREELAKYLLYERKECEAKFASLQASDMEDTKNCFFMWEIALF